MCIAKLGPLQPCKVCDVTLGAEPSRQPHQPWTPRCCGCLAGAPGSPSAGTPGCSALLLHIGRRCCLCCSWQTPLPVWSDWQHSLHTKCACDVHAQLTACRLPHKAFGKAFSKAFGTAFGKAFGKVLKKPLLVPLEAACLAHIVQDAALVLPSCLEFNLQPSVQQLDASFVLTKLLVSMHVYIDHKSLGQAVNCTMRYAVHVMQLALAASRTQCW